MAKEKKSVELRAVDDGEGKESRIYRLHKDAVEEVGILPAVRVGEKLLPEARLEAAGKIERRTRSNEPDVRVLIERDAEQQESQWNTSEQSKGLPWGWMALVGCAFAAGILWSLAEVNRSQERREGLVEEAEGILEKEKEEEMEAEAMIATIEKVVEDFHDSRSVDELLRYARHPERVKPLMEKHYGGSPPVPMRLRGILGLDPLTIENNARFWMVLCEREDGSTGQLLVEALSPDVAKVDWETSVCYQPMEWDAFAKERPGGYTGDFRVYVEADNFYSHEFADSELFACFRLTALDGEEVLYGYVNRATPLARKLESLVAENNGQAIPLILSLYVPEGARSKRGVAIRKLVAPRWMFMDSPEVGSE